MSDIKTDLYSQQMYKLMYGSDQAKAAAQAYSKSLGWMMRYESPFSEKPLKKKTIPTNKLLLLCN